jgi:ADP-heptose:LPS heptosyltransferase
LCDEIRAAAGLGAQTRCGDMSLNEFVECISAARFVVSNESAAVHIAAVLGIPAVCVAGGGHFNRFVPYPDGRGPAGAPVKTVDAAMECFGCQWRCRYTNDPDTVRPCVEEIGVESVWEAVRGAVSIN